MERALEGAAVVMPVVPRSRRSSISRSTSRSTSSRSPTSRRIGRPTKLTPEVHDRIVSLIRAGNYAEVAAVHVGIHPSSYYLWMQKGRDHIEACLTVDGERPDFEPTVYSEFYESVKAAESKGEVSAVGVIQKAMDVGDDKKSWSKAVRAWPAAMTYLERKFPERWSRGERREITGKDGGPVQVEASPIPLSRLPPEGKRELLEVLRKYGVFEGEGGGANTRVREKAVGEGKLIKKLPGVKRKTLLPPGVES